MMFEPNCFSAAAFHACVMPSLAFGSIPSAIERPGVKVTDAGGRYAVDAKGGNGLAPPVPENPAHGLFKGSGVVDVPFRVNVGANGLFSVVWSSVDTICGAVNIPKPAWDAVCGSAWGCHATPTRGSQ